MITTARVPYNLIQGFEQLLQYIHVVSLKDNLYGIIKG